MWLEIFKSGEHKDSSGKLRKFTDDMLDNIANLYNGKVKESTSYQAPLVKGHPKTDDPAYGWIEKLKRKGNLLIAKVKDVSAGLVDEVKNGLFKKISIALYPDLMLRHVGLLGAATPAVKGLRNVEFSDDKEFDELITNDQLLITNEEGMSEGQYDGKTERSFGDRICELEDENCELRMRNEELERGIRINEYREFVNSLIEFDGGAIITPAQGEELVDILIKVDYFDMQFNERQNDGMTEGQKDRNTEERKNTMVERIKSLFNGMKPRLPGVLFSDSFSHKSAAVSQQSKGERNFDLNGNVNPDRLELHEKIKHIMSEKKEMSYEQAALFAQGM